MLEILIAKVVIMVIETSVLIEVGPSLIENCRCRLEGIMAVNSLAAHASSMFYELFSIPQLAYVPYFVENVHDDLFLMITCK